MVQYQETLILNQNLIKAVNWEQTTKHVFLTYKNSVTNNKVADYGEA